MSKLYKVTWKCLRGLVAGFFIFTLLFSVVAEPLSSFFDDDISDLLMKVIGCGLIATSVAFSAWSIYRDIRFGRGMGIERFPLWLTYLVLLVGAGHAVVPIAYLLVAGSHDAWLVPQILGWTGLVTEIVAGLYSSRALGGILRAIGMLALVASAINFIDSLLDPVGLIFLIPFATTVLVRGVSLRPKRLAV